MTHQSPISWEQAESLSNTPAGASVIAEELTGTAGRIDQTFLATGEKLMACVQLLGQILTAFKMLEDAYTSEEMAAACRTIRAVGEDGRKFLDGFVAERAILSRIRSTIGKAKGPMSELSRTINMIGAIAINARMVAAAMLNGSEELTVFTSDVMDLSRKAAATMDEMEERYAKLLPDLTLVNARSEHFEKRYVGSIGGLSERVEVHLEALDRQRHTNLALGGEVRAMSSDFSGRVSDVVSALQIGDATRQRVEHVVDALKTIAALEAGAATAGDDPLPEDEADRRWLAELIVLIQDGQLEAASRHFTGEAEAARRTLTALSADLERAFRQAMAKLNQAGPTRAAPLADLDGEVSLTVENLSASTTECDGIQRVVNAVEDTVRDLLESARMMRQIEHEVRLVSLNTAISCSKLGADGRALSVISLQLRELTGDMVALSEQVCRPLGEAGEIARELSEEECECGAEQVVAIENRGREALALLGGVETRMNETKALFDEVGPQIARLAQDAVGVFDQQDEIAAELNATSDRLRSLCDFMAAGLEPAGMETAAAAKPVLDRMRRRCTMAEERNIHDQLASEMAPDGGAPAEAA
ncbi:hypothetical protein [Consotaella salsifontis]|uniref:Methyl-accepting chemotaxis protein n=1 Tax=Consotaella salsifontis TaxID=1365950 RepID=A0A1T4QV47_9HYPH|nr:hypothetical protein [Consotaella salsifontis]SKA07574.1 hypothetical protein SAMN05428963_105280 [Consotaella salsifontis]